ncbi:hypothetical protein AB4Y30_11520 [Ornithinibacillus sp. 4-3]|uniref:Transglycosylase n=1 Tax=Ornithinibacillus sp. 4-3 TaxID=3231488 RepID=A0AB39HN21_9BACI
MNNKVLCEKCDNMIVIPKSKRRVLQNAIHEHYFCCPECDYKYVTYYTDQRLRKEINRQEKRWKKYREAPTEERKRSILAEINLNKRMLAKDSDVLKQKMQRELI